MRTVSDIDYSLEGQSPHDRDYEAQYSRMLQASDRYCKVNHRADDLVTHAVEQNPFRHLALLQWS